jgi:H2-forming N5,N10-methylenetetrahydromethanopterin dehydrogenase-like enzyme
MSDKTRDMIESSLAGQLKLVELQARINGLVSLITASGVEGIQEVAKTDPELLLTTLKSLTSMMTKTQESNNQLLEYWISAMDREDEYAELMRRIIDGA